jgi:allantoate deiminase
MQRCDALARHSEQTDCLTRRFLSSPMHSVHRDLRGWMVASGMTVRVDAAGNIIGRRPANVPGEPKILLMGSHLDTVPNAGKYDGILGVLISLAVIEALKDDRLPFAIDVLGFSEEEGVRYSQPYLGSRAICGSFDVDWMDRVDEAGITMREAIAQYGLNPQGMAEAAYDSECVIGYIEAHIEQGPVLESKGTPVAVVESIVGQSRLMLTFSGKAGHAGTTPMAARQDALVGAARFVQAVQDLGQRTEGLRATVGRLNVTPNASNVIPSRVELSLDIRHALDPIRIQAVQELLVTGNDIAVREGLHLEVLHRSDTSSVHASRELVDLLSQAITSHGIESYKMSSGAGHDAVVMAEKFPVAMLFIRHPEGISHHPDERVDEDDVAIATEILISMVRLLARNEFPL